MTDNEEKGPSLAKMPTSKIQELADGHYSERKWLSGDEILQPTHELLRQLEQALNRAYLLTYLEAKLRCDEFFEGKLHAGDVGEKYGYINSRVEMNKGSIDMYFQSKRPGQDGFSSGSELQKPRKPVMQKASYDAMRRLSLKQTSRCTQRCITKVFETKQTKSNELKNYFEKSKPLHWEADRSPTLPLNLPPISMSAVTD